MEYSNISRVVWCLVTLSSKWVLRFNPPSHSRQGATSLVSKEPVLLRLSSAGREVPFLKVRIGLWYSMEHLPQDLGTWSSLLGAQSTCVWRTKKFAKKPKRGRARHPFHHWNPGRNHIQHRKSQQDTIKVCSKSRSKKYCYPETKAWSGQNPISTLRSN